MSLSKPTKRMHGKQGREGQWLHWRVERWEHSTTRTMKNTACLLREPTRPGSTASENWKGRSSRLARSFREYSRKPDCPASRPRSRLMLGYILTPDEDSAT